MTVTLTEIQRLVRDYSDARDSLAEVAQEIRDLQRAAVRVRLRSVRARAAKASAARDALTQAIEENANLFERPRTHSLHGIKFGLRKAPGKLVGDQEEAIALIKERRPHLEATLVQTKRSLVKRALINLDKAELAAIGLSIDDGGDQVVVQAASGEIDQVVDALLADIDDVGDADD